MIFTAGGLASPALAAMGEENKQHTYVFLLNVEERATAMECPCNLPVRRSASSYSRSGGVRSQMRKRSAGIA
jgi:hypothetical protein